MLNKTVLVLSGGGTKGISHLGALHALEENSILNNINTISCSSVGAVIGTLYSIGYRPIELNEIFMESNFSKMKSPQKGGIFTHYGIDNGNRFMKVVTELMKAKGINSEITFEEHFALTNKKLIITGSCLDDRKIYYFSKDTYPKMLVSKAIRISIAFPFFFTPIDFEGKLFSDGGCIDNYPISIIENKLNEIIGIYLSDAKTEVKKVDSFEQFIYSSIECIFEGRHLSILRGYENQTIHVKVTKSNFMDFDISKQSIKLLFDQGYDHAIKFINDQKNKTAQNGKINKKNKKKYLNTKQYLNEQNQYVIPFKKIKNLNV